MAEVRINGSVEFNPSKYEFYVTWEETFGGDYLTTNQSTITLRSYGRRKADYTSYTTQGTMTNTIDGTNSSATGLTIDLQANTNPRLIRTSSKLITHNADGTKQINVSAHGQIGPTSGSYTPGEGTVSSTQITLATIPRGAVITNTNVDFTLGTSIPLTFTNPANMWVRGQLIYTGDSSVISTVNFGQVTSGTLTYTASTLYAKIPNSQTAACIVRLETYDNSGYTGTQVGTDSDLACTGTVDIPTSKPTFAFTTSKVEHKDKTVTVLDKYGNTVATTTIQSLIGVSGSTHKDIGIQGYSDLRATITLADKAIANNSATMTGQLYTFVNGTQYNTATYSAVADVTIDIASILSATSSVYPTDSRSLSTVVNSTLTYFAPYTPIDLFSSGLKATRANGVDAATTLVFFGSYWKKWFSDGSAATGNAIGSTVTGGGPGYGAGNILTVEYRFKESTAAWGAQAWTTLTSGFTTTNGNIAFSATINGDLGAAGFTTTKAFDIEIRAYDKLSVDIVETRLSTGIPAMHLNKYGLAIGAKHTGSTGKRLEVTGEQSLSSHLNLGGDLKDLSGNILTVGRLLGTTLLTSASGTFSTSALTKKILVYVQAGGGGGGGATSTAANISLAGAGSGGGMSIKLFTVTPSTNYNYTCGAKGTGGAAAATTNPGNNGTDSTFVVGGVTVTAKGGIGGVAGGNGNTANVVTGVVGGAVGTNGDINKPGSASDFAIRQSGAVAVGANGADSTFGSGGLGIVSATANGNNAVGYGAGGSGAMSVNAGGQRAGGDGSDGCILVYEFT